MGENIGKTLWIDGLKYELESPKNEPNEFEPRVVEHIQDIFGKNSIYLNKYKLKSIEGRYRIPDGFVITFHKGKSQLYIIEYEISKKLDNDYSHTLVQLLTFKVGLNNPETKLNLINKFTDEIRGDDIKNSIAKQNCQEISQLAHDIIEKVDPIIVVIADSIDASFKSLFQDLKPHYIEFQTFKNGKKYAYVFDRYKEFEVSPPQIKNKDESIMLDMFSLVKVYLSEHPLSTQKQIIEGIPEFKRLKKADSYLWNVLDKYGDGVIEYTEERPARLKLKSMETTKWKEQKVRPMANTTTL